MYILAFDTTGAGCNIVLMDNQKVLDSFEHLAEFGQAEILMPQLKTMLEKNKLSFAEIGALFVCVGPGSFTGVRSGIAAARIFSFTNPKLIVGGVSAFEAYRQSFEPEDIAEINAIIVETRRDDFYVQLFDKSLQKITEPEALSYEHLLEKLKKKGKLVSLSGDGVERFLSKPSGLTLHAVKLFETVSAKAVAMIGLKMLEDKKINFPKPLYLRAPDVTLPTK